MKNEPALDSRPDMTVYYMSIPDTAPEFLDESGLLSYFKGAMARLAKTRSALGVTPEKEGGRADSKVVCLQKVLDNPVIVY